MEQYADVQQLLKKKDGQNRKPIYPPTVIQAVFDGKTGASLEAILAQFNSVYVQYQGTPKDTRLIIPMEMRRAGLTITYMDMDSNTITERANSAVQKDNDHWGLDVNWNRVDELSLSGDISVSANGTWIINGKDTGVKALGPKGDTGLTPWLKTIDNKLHFSYDNVTWEPCSDYIAGYFRIEGNKLQISRDKSTWENVSDFIAAWFRWNDNKIQISRDNKTWTDFSSKFADNVHIKGYVANYASLPTGAVQGDIYGVGPTYAAEDTAHTNPIYRYYVRNANTWVDNGQFTSIAAGVVQETGDSETEVISQKAVSTKLSKLESEIGVEQIRNINLVANVAINRKDSEINCDIKEGKRILLFIQDTENLLVNSNDGYLMAADSAGTEYALVTKVNKNVPYEVILKQDIKVIWFYRSADKVNGTGQASLILTFPDGAINLVKLHEDAITQLENENAKVQPIVELFRKKDGKNLFNKNASGILNNKYLDATTGELVESDEMSVSDYINVEKGKTYTFFVPISWFGETNSRSVHYYIGENKQHLRAAGAVNSETSSCTFTSEYDGWIRISYKTIQVNSVMVVEGDTYPSTYTPYPSYVLQDAEIEGDVDYSVNNPIYGKKILYVGDSIGEGLTAGDGKHGWSGRIAEMNKGTYYSKAQSGGVITRGLGSSIPCISDKLSDMANGNIVGDYVILEGGTNDADRIGNATEENKPSAFGSFTKDDFSGSYDDQTFCGAVESLIYTAITSFNGARVGFMIAPKMANSELTKESYNNRRFYFDTIKAICQKWGIPCLDMWEKGFLNPYIKSHYDNSLTSQGNTDAGKLYVDGQHLTAKGYDYLTPLINAWLKSI